MSHRMLRVSICALGALATACSVPLAPAGFGTTVEHASLMPVLDALEPESPVPGDEVTLHGYFHKVRPDDGLFVSFNGYDSQRVTYVNQTTIKAVVPEGATSGNVVVVIGQSVGKGRFVKIRDKKRKP